MEPKLSSPNLGPERPSVPYEQNTERPSFDFTPEVAPEQRFEHIEQRAEASPVEALQPMLPPPVVIPAPQAQDDATSAQVVPADDGMPLVANDDDLIEREWVDKAKQIIVATKDDPYRREQEVGKLQADYLRKRYGRELGAPKE
jgi:hypothetical protein